MADIQLMRQVTPITFRDVLSAADLLAEYAAECSIAEIGEICPQPQIYEALEKAGIVHLFGGYVDGQLVGFASLLMTILPHYGRKTATVESLFVAQAHRGSSIGAVLMATMEATAKDAGCAAILYSAPAGGKLERLLEARKPYRRTNAVFCRRLN
jgi:GNAT superfamily N-acetyltransferase